MAPALSCQQKYLSFFPPGTGAGESSVAAPAAVGHAGRDPRWQQETSPRSTRGSLLPRSPSAPLPEPPWVLLGAGWALGCSSHPPGRDPLWPPPKASACPWARPAAERDKEGWESWGGGGAGLRWLGSGKNAGAESVWFVDPGTGLRERGQRLPVLGSIRSPRGSGASAGHPTGVGIGSAVPSLPGHPVPPSLGDTTLGLGFSSPENPGPPQNLRKSYAEQGRGGKQMLLCLLVSPSSASARCHRRSSEDCHRRPCRAAQSSGGAQRRRQAGTRCWTGFQVQGRTGTGTGSCQGDMLVARQRCPWHVCVPMCTEHHQLHSVFWEGVRGPAAERCPGMGMPVAARLWATRRSRPWLGFLMGFAANVLAPGQLGGSVACGHVAGEPWVSGVTAPRGWRCRPGPVPARCSGYWSCAAGGARGCANTLEEPGPKAAVCSQCRQAQ